MKRSWVGIGVGAVVAGVVACGGGDELAGEMLEDAGQLLVDAGVALVDASSGVDGRADAQVGGSADSGAGAQAGGGTKSETHEVTCVDTVLRTVTNGGTTTRSLARIAELSTGTSDITGVDAIVCGREGDYPAEYCPPGATCIGSSFLPPSECFGTLPSLDSGKLRVVCGQFIEVNGVAQAGPRWRTARITIRR